MRNRREAALKAWKTIRIRRAFIKARAAEAASKEALKMYCAEHGWRVAFFEGATGSPRTGIIDAIMFRLGRKDCDLLDIRLVQLKSGKAGASGVEIRRLKKATTSATVKWLIAAFDAEVLQFSADDPV